MRSVRCDQCGMRAMLAASQCPHCSHLFELRDGFGEFLPLAHCTSCDSYYPLRQGSCRWCGTKPEGFRIAPYAWKGVGVLACVGLGWGAWLANRTSNDGAVVVSLPVEKPTVTLTTQVDSGVDFVAPILGEFSDTLSAYAPTTAVATDSAFVDSTSVGQAPAPYAVDTVPTRVPPAATVRPAAATKPAARPARSVRWVRATARRWVTVRASATNKSRIVASIGPDTRVQLGESRGDWRRIRTKGISGWVEGSRF